MSESTAKSFKVPKIKRQESKDNLRTIELKSRDAAEIGDLVKRSYLERNYKSPWQLKQLHLVDNKELEESYRTKKVEMKEEGRHSRDLLDQYAFLMFRDSAVMARVIKQGLVARPMPFNALGGSKFGVYLCRNADVQLRLAEGKGLNNCTLVVFKITLGKCKVLAQQSMTEGENIEPTPNYDCHISQAQAKPSDQLYLQLARSQVYLYEYTDECIPSERPRQCLPYAILAFEKQDVSETTSAYGKQSSSASSSSVKPEETPGDSSSKLKRTTSFSESPEKSKTLSGQRSYSDPNFKPTQHDEVPIQASIIRTEPRPSPRDPRQARMGVYPSEPRQRPADPRLNPVDPRLNNRGSPKFNTGDAKASFIDPRINPSDPRVQARQPGSRFAPGDPRQNQIDPRITAVDPRKNLSDPRLNRSDPRNIDVLHNVPALNPADPRIGSAGQNRVQVDQASRDPRLRGNIDADVQMSSAYRPSFGPPIGMFQRNFSDNQEESATSQSTVNTSLPGDLKYSRDPRLRNKFNKKTAAASPMKSNSDSVLIDQTDSKFQRKKLSIDEYKKKVVIQPKQDINTNMQIEIESQFDDQLRSLSESYYSENILSRLPLPPSSDFVDENMKYESGSTLPSSSDMSLDTDNQSPHKTYLPLRNDEDIDSPYSPEDFEAFGQDDSYHDDVVDDPHKMMQTLSELPEPDDSPKMAEDELEPTKPDNMEDALLVAIKKLVEHSPDMEVLTQAIHVLGQTHDMDTISEALKKAVESSIQQGLKDEAEDDKKKAGKLDSEEPIKLDDSPITKAMKKTLAEIDHDHDAENIEKLKEKRETKASISKAFPSVEKIEDIPLPDSPIKSAVEIKLDTNTKRESGVKFFLDKDEEENKNKLPTAGKALFVPDIGAKGSPGIGFSPSKSLFSGVVDKDERQRATKSLFKADKDERQTASANRLKSELYGPFALDQDERLHGKKLPNAHAVAESSIVEDVDERQHSRSASPSIDIGLQDIDERQSHSRSLSPTIPAVSLTSVQNDSVVPTDSNILKLSDLDVDERSVHVSRSESPTSIHRRTPTPIMSPDPETDDSLMDAALNKNNNTISEPPEIPQESSIDHEEPLDIDLRPSRSENDFGDVDWRLTAASEMGDVDLRAKQGQAQTADCKLPPAFEAVDDFWSKRENKEGDLEFRNKYHSDKADTSEVHESYDGYSISNKDYERNKDYDSYEKSRAKTIPSYSTAGNVYGEYSSSNRSELTNTKVGPVDNYSAFQTPMYYPEGHQNQSFPPLHQPVPQQPILQQQSIPPQPAPIMNFNSLLGSVNLDFSNLKNILATVQKPAEKSEPVKSDIEIAVDEDEVTSNLPAFVTGLCKESPKKDATLTKYSGRLREAGKKHSFLKEEQQQEKSPEKNPVFDRTIAPQFQKQKDDKQSIMSLVQIGSEKQPIKQEFKLLNEIPGSKKDLDQNKTIEKGSIFDNSKEKVIEKDSISDSSKNNEMKSDSVLNNNKSDKIGKESLLSNNKSNKIEKDSILNNNKGDKIGKDSILNNNKGDKIGKDSILNNNKSDKIGKDSILNYNKSDKLEKESILNKTKSIEVRKERISNKSKSNKIETDRIENNSKGNASVKTKLNEIEKDQNKSEKVRRGKYTSATEVSSSNVTFSVGDIIKHVRDTGTSNRNEAKIKDSQPSKNKAKVNDGPPAKDKAKPKKPVPKNMIFSIGDMLQQMRETTSAEREDHQADEKEIESRGPQKEEKSSKKERKKENDKLKEKGKPNLNTSLTNMSPYQLAIMEELEKSDLRIKHDDSLVSEPDKESPKGSKHNESFQKDLYTDINQEANAKGLATNWDKTNSDIGKKQQHFSPNDAKIDHGIKQPASYISQMDFNDESDNSDEESFGLVIDLGETPAKNANEQNKTADDDKLKYSSSMEKKQVQVSPTGKKSSTNQDISDDCLVIEMEQEKPEIVDLTEDDTDMVDEDIRDTEKRVNPEDDADDGPLMKKIKLEKSEADEERERQLAEEAKLAEAFSLDKTDDDSELEMNDHAPVAGDRLKRVLNQPRKKIVINLKSTGKKPKSSSEGTSKKADIEKSNGNVSRSDKSKDSGTKNEEEQEQAKPVSAIARLGSENLAVPRAPSPITVLRGVHHRSPSPLTNVLASETSNSPLPVQSPVMPWQQQQHIQSANTSQYASHSTGNFSVIPSLSQMTSVPPPNYRSPSPVNQMVSGMSSAGQAGYRAASPIDMVAPNAVAAALQSLMGPNVVTGVTIPMPPVGPTGGMGMVTPVSMGMVTPVTVAPQAHTLFQPMGGPHMSVPPPNFNVPPPHILQQHPHQPHMVQTTYPNPYPGQAVPFSVPMDAGIGPAGAPFQHNLGMQHPHIPTLPPNLRPLMQGNLSVPFVGQPTQTPKEAMMQDILQRIRQRAPTPQAGHSHVSPQQGLPIQTIGKSTSDSHQTSSSEGMPIQTIGKTAPSDSKHTDTNLKSTHYEEHNQSKAKSDVLDWFSDKFDIKKDPKYHSTPNREKEEKVSEHTDTMDISNETGRKRTLNYPEYDDYGKKAKLTPSGDNQSEHFYENDEPVEQSNVVDVLQLHSVENLNKAKDVILQSLADLPTEDEDSGELHDDPGMNLSDLEEGELSDDSITDSPLKTDTDNRRVVVQNKVGNNIQVQCAANDIQRIQTIGYEKPSSPKRIVRATDPSTMMRGSGASERHQSHRNSAAVDWSNMLQSKQSENIERDSVFRRADQKLMGMLEHSDSGEGAGILASSAALITKTKQKIMARTQIKTLGDWLKNELEIERVGPLQKYLPYSLDMDLTAIPKGRRRKMKTKVRAELEKKGSFSANIKSTVNSLIEEGKSSVKQATVPGQSTTSVQPASTVPNKKPVYQGPPINPNYLPEVPNSHIQTELELLKTVQRGLKDARSSMSVTVKGGDKSARAVSALEPGSQKELQLIGAIQAVETEMVTMLQRTYFYGYPHRRVPNDLLLESEKYSFKSPDEDLFLMLLMPLSIKPYNKLKGLKREIEALIKRISSAKNAKELKGELKTLHSQREGVLRSFTGCLNKKRITKIQDLVNKYTLVYDHFKRQSRAPPDSALKFIRTTQIDLRQHLILAKQYLAMEEKTQV